MECRIGIARFMVAELHHKFRLDRDVGTRSK
jgi:hypothetical protein